MPCVINQLSISVLLWRINFIMNKKVIFVFHKVDSASGGNASMLDVVRNIKNNCSFDILAIVPKHYNNSIRPIASVLNELGIPSIESSIYSSRYEFTGLTFKTPFRIFKCVVRNIISIVSCVGLYRKIKSEKVALIYSNTSDVYVGSILAKFLGIKHIWHFREFGIEDQRNHHLMGDYAFYKFADSFSDEIIVISEALKKKVTRFIPSAKINMIYDDLTIANKDLIVTRKGAISYPKILMVGTLSPGKGQLEVIHALTALKEKNIDFKLGIAGRDTGEYALFLKSEVARLGLQNNVDFLGFSDNLAVIRNEYNIGVVASHAEAFGRVTIEAMFSGLIVIGVNNGANNELIKNNVTGFIYQTADELVSTVLSIINGEYDIEAIRTNAVEYASLFLKGKASSQIMELVNKHIQ